MEELNMLTFAVSVMVISISGAMMPGPVTAVTLARGSETPHAGAWVSIGHGVIEFPLMAVIYFGAGALFRIAPVEIAIGLAGGAILLYMGAGMLRDFDKVSAPGEEQALSRFSRSPFLAGIFLSASNPYFLVWWATAGAALVSQSLKFGVIGFFVLALAHWMTDFGWLYFLSSMSFHGGKFFGKRLQQAVFLICGMALVFFSGFFIARALFSVTHLS